MPMWGGQACCRAMKTVPTLARLAIYVLFAFLLIAPAARAQIQVSSLGNAETGSLGVNINEWVGLAFTTDSQSYTLGGITIPIYVNTAGTLGAELYAGTAGGDPAGSALASFNFGTIPGTTGNVTFTPGSTITLSASTNYVFVLSATDVGTWGWSAAPASSTYTTPSGNPWTMGTNATLSFDGGGSWSQPAPFMPRMSVNATPVPEPSAYAAVLGAAALAGVMFARRRRA